MNQISNNVSEIFGFIYLHINKINNKKYVGQTTKSNVERRFQNGAAYSKDWQFVDGNIKTIEEIDTEMEKAKPVLCIETGCAYFSAEDATRKLGLKPWQIRSACSERKKLWQKLVVIVGNI